MNEQQPTTNEQELKQMPVATGWKRWLNYQSVVKQIPFFLFLTLLAIIYIYNGHYADRIARNINRTSRDVKELQHEYKTVKSEVMFRSKQSELIKAVEPLGLKELTESPTSACSRYEALQELPFRSHERRPLLCHPGLGAGQGRQGTQAP